MYMCGILENLTTSKYYVEIGGLDHCGLSALQLCVLYYVYVCMANIMCTTYWYGVLVVFLCSLML